MKIPTGFDTDDLPFSPDDLRLAPSAQPTVDADPFANLDSLRLSQNFAALAPVKRVLTRVPVQKPDKQQFVRVRPGEQWRLQTAVLEFRDDREVYLVAAGLWPELEQEVHPVVLLTGITKSDVLFLWPIKLPGPDGRSNPWNDSALLAAQTAEREWTRVVANMARGAYDLLTAAAPLPDPEWPDLTFPEILRIAFKDRFVNSLDHPAVRRLRGEV